jgi:uncharacterized protein YpmS
MYRNATALEISIYNAIEVDNIIMDKAKCPTWVVFYPKKKTLVNVELSIYVFCQS